MNAAPEAAQFAAEHSNLMFDDQQNVTDGSITTKNPTQRLDANQNFLYSDQGV